MKRANPCALIGFLLTIVNIGASVTLIILDKASIILISAPIAALISLILSIVGVAKSGRLESGKAISIIGIILNALILIAVAVFFAFIILFVQACAGMLDGIFSTPSP